jgi:hypothetical protein
VGTWKYIGRLCVEWVEDEYGASGFGGDGGERGDLCSAIGSALGGGV